MTTKEQVQRNNKSNGLKVFQTMDGHYYVESSEGKIAYRVSCNNGTKACSCGDYSSRVEKDPSFQCKHIMAVINGNGSIRDIEAKPTLDERFIIEIKRKDTTKEFVLYAGLLDLAHQKGIRKMIVEAIQYPTKDNKMEAICKATVESNDGEIFTELADANPLNVNRMVVEHMLRVAATRAKARALRDFTNIGMTCLEELGDLDDLEDDSGKSKTRSKREIKAEAVNTATTTQATPKQEQQKGGATVDEQRTEPDKKTKPKKEAGQGTTGTHAVQKDQDQKASDTKTEENQVKPFEAQMKAIEKLAERRGINGEQIVKMFTEKYKKPYEQINASEAKDFIRHLQQAA